MLFSEYIEIKAIWIQERMNEDKYNNYPMFYSLEKYCEYLQILGLKKGKELRHILSNFYDCTNNNYNCFINDNVVDLIDFVIKHGEDKAHKYMRDKYDKFNNQNN